MDIGQETNRLRVLYESGRLPAALECGKRLLAEMPTDAGLVAITGGIAIELKHFDYAESILSSAIEVHPDDTELRFLLGTVASSLKQYHDAVKQLEIVVIKNPDHQKAMINLANAYVSLDNPERAVEILERVVKKWPDCSEALNNLGILLKVDGKKEATKDVAIRLVELSPNDVSAWAALGEACRKSDDRTEAIDAFLKVLTLEPGHIDAALALSELFAKEKRYADAVKVLKGTLALHPLHKNIRYQLATHLFFNNDIHEAKRVLEPATAQQENTDLHIGVLFLFANILTKLQELQRAEGVLQDLVDNYQDVPFAYQNLALLQQSRGDFRKSLETSRNSLAASNNHLGIYQNHLYFLSYHPDYDQETIYKEYEKWAEISRAQQPDWSPSYRNSLTTGRKLKIGYASPDLRGHVVTYFFRPIFDNHDRDKFEIHLFSSVTEPDAHTDYFKARADYWHDLRGVKRTEQADLIQDNEIDVLIDLAGHTSGNILHTFLLKPAPIQATWIGYANSTGLPEIDYRFTDAIADPEGPDDDFYAEQLVRLKQGFLCYNGGDIDWEPKLPALDRGYVTFGCFNQTRKLNEEMIALWAKAIAPIKNARVLLKSRELAAAENQRLFQDLFEKHGLERHRVSIVAATKTYEDHADYFAKVDIALDPSPYNGTTSTCEALWMGVPVLTTYGKVHAARVSASILDQIGLFDRLVSHSDEDFIQKAQALANDLNSLQELRAGMRDRIKKSKLNDFKAHTREVEDFYQKWWADYVESQAGRPNRQ